jgi:hypothetical protein
MGRTGSFTVLVRGFPLPALAEKIAEPNPEQASLHGSKTMAQSPHKNENR